MIRPGQLLVGVTYFTARVTKPLDKQLRQGVYLDALRSHGGIEIVEGAYEHRPMRCPDCGRRWHRPQEKRSDVNIAVRLLLGAVDDVYDAALIVSADADLIPVLGARRRPDRRPSPFFGT